MICEKPHKNLLDFAEGRLSAPEHAEVEAHLAACPDCREFLGVLQDITSVIDSRASVKASDDFTRRVVNSAGQSAAPARVVPFYRIVTDLVAASILAAALLGGIYVGRGVGDAARDRTSLIEEKVRYINDMSHEPVESFILTLYSDDHEK